MISLKRNVKIAAMRPSNLDDISAVAGYSATRALQVWFGGRFLYVPVRSDPDHPLAMLVGEPALKALVREFGNEVLWIPGHDEERRYARNRDIAIRFSEGATPADIANEFTLTPRRAMQVRLELREKRWLQFAEGYQPRRKAPAPALPQLTAAGVETSLVAPGESGADAPAPAPLVGVCR